MNLAFYCFDAKPEFKSFFFSSVLKSNVVLLTSASAFILIHALRKKHMTIVNIQRDGTVYLALSPNGLLVKILNGNLEVGKYEKES